MRVYLLAFKLQAARESINESDSEEQTAEVISVFQKIYTNQHVAGEDILECFGVLAAHRNLYAAAVQIGAHLVKACDRLILDCSEQKRFLMKFLFIFDT